MNVRKSHNPITAQHLRDAVSQLLSDRIPTSSYVRREIKASLQAVVRTLLDAGWDAYIVGGTLRDMMLGPDLVGVNAYIPRDIDIVVVGAQQQELKKMFSIIYDRETRFGGLHLVDRKREGWKVLFDMWPLEQTWVFSVAPLPIDISSFPQTPFLNLDTAAVELRGTPGRARRVYDNGFIDGINHHIIELVFEPNPYPNVCLIRALIMAAKLQFTIGSRLLEFILRQAQDTSISDLMAAQRSHYGTYRCSAEELSSWIRMLEQSVRAGCGEGRIPIRSVRQLALWNDYPPSSEQPPSSPDECDQLLVHV